MISLGHLRVEGIKLTPSQEWMDASGVWRFLQVDSGAAYWLGAPVRRALVEGELLILPPGCKALVRASQLNEVALHGFGFAPDALYSLFTLGERHLFNSRPVPEQMEVLASTHPLSRRFAALAASLGERTELARRAEALCIAVEILDLRLGQPGKPPLSGSNAHQRFEMFIAMMPESELIQQTVAGLAHLCGCSPRHFSRMFQRRFGDSVRARQMELRLLKARQLLGTTGERVSEVALASGYRNVSMFNLLFKRRFGMTPSEWRNQARAESGETVATESLPAA
jgi:AraC-like DNA-binding protein